MAIEHRHRLLSATLCDTSPAAVPGGSSLWQAPNRSWFPVGRLDADVHVVFAKS
jgi:hypothetical protein